MDMYKLRNLADECILNNQMLSAIAGSNPAAFNFSFEVAPDTYEDKAFASGSSIDKILKGELKNLLEHRNNQIQGIILGMTKPEIK